MVEKRIRFLTPQLAANCRDADPDIRSCLARTTGVVVELKKET
ncbi:MAG: hypothetical protein OEV64_08295 [Desulfobulbaceae bacterium]|nr:hypothetical protein [Desulfobulbaceae bacterium]